jgi:eukaryotic-like serine/threonine-protein kinase
MGEVYRARDARLNRDVALKILPSVVAADADRLARFVREAQVLASLNHPNIGQIYGLERQDGREGQNGLNALVLELVEGPTLADRIAAGALPIEEAVTVARQIAEALEAAHEQGIVHRDLKPSNVKLRPDGTVKVLDFGLAKALDARSSAPLDLSLSPTVASPATMQATILGTAAYMAPEQAKGKAVDKRADIWAFGIVFSEMLTGRAMYAGETVSEILAAVIMKPPDLSMLPASMPAVVRRLIERCLDRDPKTRLRDIGEARIALERYLLNPAATGADVAAPVPPRTTRRFWTASAAAVLVIGVAAFWLGMNRRQTVAPPPVGRFDIDLPAKGELNLISRPAIGLSPDGSQIVFAAVVDGVSRLYVRRRDAIEARMLPGTEEGSNPVFSPDGKWLAFVGGNKLKKMQLDGTPVPLADAPDARGVDWLGDNTLVFAPNATGSLYTIPAVGGPAKPITTIDEKSQERTHRWPVALPDGRAVLFTVGTFASPDNYDESAIDVVTLSSGARHRVLERAAFVRLVPGYLLFSRSAVLSAVPFDAATLTVSATPVQVLQGINGDTTTGASDFSLAGDGTLAYVPGDSHVGLNRPVWVDHKGATERLDLEENLYFDPRVSPDGSRVAMTIGGGGRSGAGKDDIWVYDVARKILTRFSFDGGDTPVWSADGSRIYYVTQNAAGTKSTILVRPADGSRDPVKLATVDSRAFLHSVSPDGRSFIIDFEDHNGQGRQIVRWFAEGSAKPEPLVATRSDEYAAAVSPDGRWLAYQSNESTRYEVYVRDLQGTGARWQVSSGGGEEPHWAPNGRELYFRSESRLLVAPVELQPTFRPGTPSVLFQGIYNMRSDSGISFDVDPRSGRFVMIRLASSGGTQPRVRFILNWLDDFRRLVMNDAKR